LRFEAATAELKKYKSLDIEKKSVRTDSSRR
jgi:hypothetical protein